MFATIDSLRSEESLRPGDPHSRAMLEIKEKEETERESVFTFSPRSRRPAPPRCCPKMTSALMIKKSPEMIRSGAVALAGGCAPELGGAVRGNVSLQAVERRAGTAA